MLDASRAKKLVRLWLPKLRWAFQLQSWQITVYYQSTGDGCSASIECYPDRSRAYLTIDPQRHLDDDDLLSSLRHELIHLALAEFELYRKQALDHIPAGRARDAADTVWHHCHERTVRRFEDMFDMGLGLDARKLSRVAGRYSSQCSDKHQAPLVESDSDAE